MNTVIQQSRPTVSIDQARPQAIIARMPNVSGSRGIGIQSAIVNEAGHLIITLSNGASIDAGYVKGTNGVGIAGVSVTNVSIDQNGHLVVTLSNATQIDAGTLVDQAATAAIQEHITATGNPHGTTAADINVYTKTETDGIVSQAINTSRIHMPVVLLGGYATDIEAIQATYPAPQEGWTASVDESNNTYRYDGDTASWIWIDAGAIPAASTAVAGKVQLTDSVTSSSTTTAATANAVKMTYDLLNGKETAIGLKGTAFNKNFGTGADDVMRGNTPIGGGSFNITIVPGRFSLVGAATEPLYAGIAGASRVWSELQFDGIVMNTAMFLIPAKVTTDYKGGTVNLRIDFKHDATATTAAPSFQFSAGIKSLAGGSALDQTAPTVGVGFNSNTYNIPDASDAGELRSIIISIPTPALIAGDTWIGYIRRDVASDVSTSLARVLSLSVHE